MVDKLAVFQGKHIRRIVHNGEWWFSIIDIVEVLTGSSIPKRYWSDLKRKLVKEGYSELYENILKLKFAAADGKLVCIGRGDGRRARLFRPFQWARQAAPLRLINGIQS